MTKRLKHGSIEQRKARFEAVKKLQAAGVGASATAKALNMGRSTVDHQRQYKTYDDLAAANKKRNDEHKRKKAEQEMYNDIQITSAEQADAADDIKAYDDLLGLLDKVCQQLQTIEKKVSFIERNTEEKSKPFWR